MYATTKLENYLKQFKKVQAHDTCSIDTEELLNDSLASLDIYKSNTRLSGKQVQNQKQPIKTRRDIIGKGRQPLKTISENEEKSNYFKPSYDLNDYLPPKPQKQLSRQHSVPNRRSLDYKQKSRTYKINSLDKLEPSSRQSSNPSRDFSHNQYIREITDLYTSHDTEEILEDKPKLKSLNIQAIQGSIRNEDIQRGAVTSRQDTRKDPNMTARSLGNKPYEISLMESRHFDQNKENFRLTTPAKPYESQFPKATPNFKSNMKKGKPSGNQWLKTCTCHLTYNEINRHNKQCQTTYVRILRTGIKRRSLVESVVFIQRHIREWLQKTSSFSTNQNSFYKQTQELQRAKLSIESAIQKIKQIRTNQSQSSFTLSESTVNPITNSSALSMEELISPAKRVNQLKFIEPVWEESEDDSSVNTEKLLNYFQAQPYLQQMAQSSLPSLIERLEGCVSRFEQVMGVSGALPPPLPPTATPGQPVPPPPPTAPTLSRQAQEYQSLVFPKLEELQQTAVVLENESLLKATEAFCDAFRFIGNIVQISSNSKQPTQEEFKQHVFPKCQEFQNKIADNKRAGTPVTNHTTALYEGVQAITWPFAPGPKDTIQNFKEAAEFYGNRIIRDKQPEGIAWWRAFLAILNANIEFVTNYPIIWSGNGQNFSTFADEIRPRQAQKQATSVKPPVKKEETKAPVVKAPRQYEQGLTIILEHFKSDKTLEVPENKCDLKRGIILDNLEDCVVQIKGKVKSVMINNCKRTGVICSDVVSGIELISCQRFQLQTTGLLPSVSIDKSAQVELFLNEQSAGVIMINTSNSSDMSATIPDPNNSEDWKQVPIPHSYTHHFASGALNTRVSDIYGSQGQLN